MAMDSYMKVQLMPLRVHTSSIQSSEKALGKMLSRAERLSLADPDTEFARVRQIENNTTGLHNSSSHSVSIH